LRGFNAFVLSSALYGSETRNVLILFNVDHYVANFGFVQLSIYPTLASFIHVVVLV